MQEWSDDPTLLSPNADSLRISLVSCGAMLDVEHDDRPIVCVNWYIAQAFCIWDGGRLPTETEWTFAAMGGDEQRPYPWSVPVFDASIDEMRACYDNVGHTCSSPMPVGSYPRGEGKWSTRDLAGNVGEWVADVWRADLAACTQDEAMTPDQLNAGCSLGNAPQRRVMKGGSFAHKSQSLLSSERTFSLAPHKLNYMGFRCAYSLNDANLGQQISK
jgi:formylglycine-generating enzyme required for sulfatase activity